MLLQNVITVALVFLAWFAVSYYSREPAQWPSTNHWLLPVLWSFIVVYLQGKRYTGTVLNAYLVFLLMLYADITGFGAVNGAIQLAYLVLTLLLALVSVLLYQDVFPGRPRLAGAGSLLITLALCVAPLCYIIYVQRFGVQVTSDVFFAINQSNTDEALAFVADYFSPAWLLAGLTIVALAGGLYRYQGRNAAIAVRRPLLLLLIAASASLAFTNRADLRLYSFATENFLHYQQELAAFRETQQQIEAMDIRLDAVKAAAGDTYLVVIGESLNKEHMGLYGYFRDTTPRLDEFMRDGDLLRFEQAFSSHTHTMYVLTKALTEADGLNGLDYFNAPSLINILNQAGVDTWWVSNQVMFGPWDNPVSVLAHQARHLVPLNHSAGKTVTTQVYDAATVSVVEDILAGPADTSRVIFVHLVGNHGLYCDRYPEEFAIWEGRIDSRWFGGQSKRDGIDDLSGRINCYDNSVRYNDHVVTALLGVLQAHGGISGFIYFADHGEDVIAKLGHNSANFTYPMTEIPLLVWLSDAYREQYPARYAALAGHTQQLFSTAYLYDTLIGLAGVQTSRYEATRDLSAPEYRFREEDAITLDGDARYTDAENPVYQQQKNIRALARDGYRDRVIPHRVNTLGKLADAWYDGYRGFELDLVYSPEAGFAVGHDAGNMSGLSLDEYLAAADHSQITRLWLDIKNLDQDNQAVIAGRLAELDARYGLRDRVILESTTSDEFFSRFRADGWHTSFYLPTGDIRTLLEQDRRDEMRATAAAIAAQCRRQQCAAVSFDSLLYPFVEQYLEPELPETVVYHTWDMALRLYDSELLSGLYTQPYFADPRVRTILLPYWSPFNL